MREGGSQLTLGSPALSVLPDIKDVWFPRMISEELFTMRGRVDSPVRTRRGRMARRIGRTVHGW